MTIPELAHVHWNSLEEDELSHEIIQVVLSHPGLLFDGIDPTLRNSFQKKDRLTEEYE